MTIDDARGLNPEGARVADADDHLASLARSDADAFGQLYQRHRLAVYRYLRARTRTDDAAIELTAVTFERALAAIARYRPAGGGFLAWLLRIARNAAIDAGRRTRGTPLAADVAATTATNEPEEAAIGGETRSALLAAVNRLPQPQREAIYLRYAARLTAREIGAVIGKSDQATQKLLARALASIRETYDVER